MVNKKNGWMHRHTGDRQGAGIRGERKALWRVSDTVSEAGIKITITKRRI